MILGGKPSENIELDFGHVRKCLQLSKHLKSILVFGDNHGWYGNPKTIEQLVEFKKEFKPDVTIHLGDNWDFSCLRKKSSAAERREELVQDFEAGCDFFKKLQPNVFLWGNHDHRLLAFIHRNQKRPTGGETMRNAPNRSISSLEEFGAQQIYDKAIKLLAELKIKSIPYGVKHFYELANYRLCHGYHYGNNPAERMVAMHGNCISGDVHRFTSYTTASNPRRTAHTIGSLCLDEQMEYQNNQPSALRHENGWGYGYIDKKSGELAFFNARAINGNFICPTFLK